MLQLESIIATAPCLQLATAAEVSAAGDNIAIPVTLVSPTGQALVRQVHPSQITSTLTQEVDALMLWKQQTFEDKTFPYGNITLTVTYVENFGAQKVLVDGGLFFIPGSSGMQFTGPDMGVSWYRLGGAAITDGIGCVRPDISSIVTAGSSIAPGATAQMTVPFAGLMPSDGLCVNWATDPGVGIDLEFKTLAGVGSLTLYATNRGTSPITPTGTVSITAIGVSTGA